jgi:hypothetical protein
MRIWFSGPRIMGIRPGISLGREDFKSPFFDRAVQVVATIALCVIFSVAAVVATTVFK